MSQDEELVALTKDAHKRVQDVIRWGEKLGFGTGREPFVQGDLNPTMGLVVGDPIPWEEAAYSGGHSDCYPGAREYMVYPARMVWVNKADNCPETRHVDTEPKYDLYLYEIHQARLTKGEPYIGPVLDEYNGIPVVFVEAGGAGGGGGGTVPGGRDCPVWSCCNTVGVVCLPNPDDPESDAWLAMACPPWVFYALPDDGGCGGDPNCGFWSCDGGDTPCGSTDDLCGCTDVGGTAAGCYPFYGDTDLQSTGISLSCLFKCQDGQLQVRDACINVVPGGPFTLRPALLNKANGRELHSPVDGGF
jgi:hypothetical protein